ncbi:MAG: translation initiation factor IF-1 [Mollicutes bacterium]|nr:MAG: translation initiation factor IF-1 [Mollicutes bacterium]
MKNKDQVFRVEGVVLANLGKGLYRVRLEKANREILAFVSGKMRKYSIQILINDRVEVEMSIYDMGKGRIVLRK